LRHRHAIGATVGRNVNGIRGERTVRHPKAPWRKPQPEAGRTCSGQFRCYAARTPEAVSARLDWRSQRLRDAMGINIGVLESCKWANCYSRGTLNRCAIAVLAHTTPAAGRVRFHASVSATEQPELAHWYRLTRNSSGSRYHSRDLNRERRHGAVGDALRGACMYPYPHDVPPVAFVLDVILQACAQRPRLRPSARRIPLPRSCPSLFGRRQ